MTGSSTCCVGVSERLKEISEIDVTSSLMSSLAAGLWAIASLLLSSGTKMSFMMFFTVEGLSFLTGEFERNYILLR